MEERIRRAVGEAFKNVVIERPSNPAHGDYAMFIGLKAAEEVAKNIREKLGSAVASVEIAGSGFVNITLAPEAVTFAIAEADAKKEEWGRVVSSPPVGGAENRVLIEYTDPNPFKEMHIGHLMNNIIGESLARLIENEGAKVMRANYQGDVGPHVAKALWGLQKAGTTEPTTAKEIGIAYTAGSLAYEESPEAKIEIDAINREVYTGTNHELMELWRRGRDVSLEAFEELYKILGAHFDYYFFESETAESGLRIVRDGIKQGVFEESEGAIIYRGEKKGLHTLVFITSAGTPTYEAKDIGLAFLKEERVQSDRSLIMTASEQIGHFKVFLAALSELAPKLAEKTTHIPHGFLRLASGKMSSREGNVITAESLIQDIIAKASEKNADPLIAEQVALGAIKYMILRQAPGSDIIFDPEKSLSLEGASGPYLQYALVRANSIVAKALPTSEVGAPTKIVGGRISEESYKIERLIVHYPEVVARSARELAPNLLVNYLTELAGEWNSFYAQEKIIGGEHEAHKLMIARAFVNTMTNGLTILGIPIPKRM